MTTMKLAVQLLVAGLLLPAVTPHMVYAGDLESSCAEISTMVDGKEVGRVEIRLGTGRDPSASCRLVVALPGLPPSRTIVSFTRRDGAHRHLTWDPLIDSRLARSIILPGDADQKEWTVSLTGTAILNPTNPQENGAWRFGWLEGIVKSEDVQIPLAYASASSGSGTVSGKVRIEVLALPSLKDAIKDLAEPEGGALGSTLVDDRRGLGMVAPVVDELFGIIAEVVVERSKSIAEKMLRERLVVWCRAVEDRNGNEILPKTCMALESLRLDTLASTLSSLSSALLADIITYAGENALTQMAISGACRADSETRDASCNAALDKLATFLSKGHAEVIDNFEGIKNSDLSSIVTSLDACTPGKFANLRTEAKSLKDSEAKHIAWKLNTLRDAFAPLAKEMNQGKSPKLTALFRGFISKILSMARLGDESTTFDAQSLVASAAGTVSEIVNEINECVKNDDRARPDGSDDAVCGYKLAFGIAGYCLGSGNCDARQIRNIVSNSNGVFTNGCGIVDIGFVDDISELVNTIIRIADPRKEDTARNRALAATRLAFTLVAWTTLAQKGVATPSEILRAAEGAEGLSCKRSNDPAACKDIRNIYLTRDIAVAAVQLDVPNVLTGLVQLVKELNYFESNTSRFTRAIGPLVAFMSTYTGGSTEDAKARRDARKAAIEALIDSSTDRGNRNGDWVFSVGGALALTGGVRCGDGESVFQGPFALPLGFGLDSYASSDSPWGFHGQLSILDLGGYIGFGATEDDETQVRRPQWEDLLNISLDIGARFDGGAATPVWFGLRAGFNPSYGVKLETDGTAERKPSWFAGLALGVYVPFFDFN